MTKLLMIALGGAIGTAGRYLVSALDYRWSQGVFPLSTLLVNLFGSLAIGFLWGLFERVMVTPGTRMFLLMGILGGFTTFSTFSLENFNLIRDGELKIAFWNIAVTNVAGLGLVFVGFFAARALSRAFN